MNGHPGKILLLQKQILDISMSQKCVPLRHIREKRGSSYTPLSVMPHVTL